MHGIAKHGIARQSSLPMSPANVNSNASVCASIYDCVCVCVGGGGGAGLQMLIMDSTCGIQLSTGDCRAWKSMLREMVNGMGEYSCQRQIY